MRLETFETPGTYSAAVVRWLPVIGEKRKVFAVTEENGEKHDWLICGFWEGYKLEKPWEQLVAGKGIFLGICEGYFIFALDKGKSE